jgi:hypothetical protein
MLCAVGTCAKGKIAILGPIKNRLLFVYKLAIWTGSISLRQKMYRGAVSLKGFQSMGNGRNSIKNRSQLFTDDLSNDTAPCPQKDKRIYSVGTLKEGTAQ